jgi:hypothetical protein
LIHTHPIGIHCNLAYVKMNLKSQPIIFLMSKQT